MRKRDWKLRNYQEGDEHQVIKLYEKVWKQPMGMSDSLKYWRWMYEKNPFGDKNIVLGVVDNEIVGQYTVIPVTMTLNDKKLTASLAAHLVVHPDYQGQRMFPQMVEHLHENLEKKSIPFTYGFPNENSIETFKKYLDWKEVLSIPLMARPINFEKSASMFFGKGIKSKIVGSLGKKYYSLKYTPLNPPPDMEITKIDKFTKEFDELWNELKENFNIALTRNSEYLNWRFVKKPGYDYEIFSLRKNSELIGYAVTYNYNYKDLEIMLIMDLLVTNHSEKYAKYLISHCVKEAKSKNLDSVCSIACGLKEYYKKTGFREIGFEQLPTKKHFGVKKNTDTVKDHILFEPSNWYISWADTPGY